MTTPRILTEFRDLIVSGLEGALAGTSLLHPVLRYHVGLEDETGARRENLGKLLRPSLVLFTATELGADPRRALPAAVGIELIHNFSLIHDDIQDGDRLRRGRPTVWSLHGIAQGINAGDLMAAIAIREALSAGPQITAALVSATIEMIEGQGLDLSFETREATVDEYMEMIDKKTGALIRGSFTLGGLVAGAEAETLNRLSDLGMALGRAFQIRDDILGIWGNGEVTGKPLGSDIRRRKKSLPVVVGLSRAGGADRTILVETYQKEGLTDADVTAVVTVLERLGAKEIAERMVKEHLGRAEEILAALPFPHKEKMTELINYLARREK